MTKKINILLFFFLCSVLIMSCHKTAEDKSSWTIAGTTYIEGSSPTYWDNGSNTLIAIDNVHNSTIELIFDSRPTSGSYPLSNSDTCNVCGPTCRVNVSTASDVYDSESRSAASISVTVGTNNKITASFSSIPMSSSTASSTDVSGTLIEK